MKIDIPLTCPKCAGKMYSITYDVVLKILKPRSWLCCYSCKFSETSDQFKKRILTV